MPGHLVAPYRELRPQATPMTSTRYVSPSSPDHIAELRGEEVYASLDSSVSGLTSVEAARRLVEYGPNAVAPVAPPRPIYRFISNFAHLMALLLWVGGGVAFVAGLPELGVAIWVVNLVNGLFSFWQ